MANKLNTNPIVIDTFAAGDIIISSEPVSIKLMQIFTPGTTGYLQLADLHDNTKGWLATIASNTTDHLEYHTHLQVDSLKVVSGHSMPAGSYLVIQV